MMIAGKGYLDIPLSKIVVVSDHHRIFDYRHHFRND